MTHILEMADLELTLLCLSDKLSKKQFFRYFNTFLDLTCSRCELVRCMFYMFRYQHAHNKVYLLNLIFGH